MKIKSTWMFFSWVGALSASGFASNTPCASGMDAFTANFHTFIRTETPCGVCHSGSHASAPAWAVENAAESYARIKGYVDFGKPMESKLLVRASNGHCGVLCQNNPALQNELIERIDGWWTGGESQCHSGHELAPIAVPAGAMNGPVTLQWSLPPKAGIHDGIKLMADVRAVVDKETQTIGGYVLKTVRARLTNPANRIQLNHLRFAVNGQFDDLANQFESLSIELSGANEKSLSNQQTLLRGKDLGADRISASFANIEKN